MLHQTLGGVQFLIAVFLHPYLSARGAETVSDPAFTFGVPENNVSAARTTDDASKHYRRPKDFTSDERPGCTAHGCES